MIHITMLIISLTLATQRVPLLDLYIQAGELIEDGSYDEAAELFDEIYARMPDSRRALYNQAVSRMTTGDYVTADSLLSAFPEDVFAGDTLLEARSSARLGNAMLNSDYAGVESVVEMLLPEIATGESSERIRQNYEVALKWLMQNEPPPPEENQNDDESEDESDNEEDESEDNEDQQEPEDNEDDQEEPQDSNDEDNQEEPDDNQESQPPPPSESEMTPEVAQMILDMVEEAPVDTTDASSGEVIGVPNW